MISSRDDSGVMRPCVGMESTRSLLLSDKSSDSFVQISPVSIVFHDALGMSVSLKSEFWLFKPPGYQQTILLP